MHLEDHVLAVFPILFTTTVEAYECICVLKHVNLLNILFLLSFDQLSIILAHFRFETEPQSSGIYFLLSFVVCSLFIYSPCEIL